MTPTNSRILLGGLLLAVALIQASVPACASRRPPAPAAAYSADERAADLASFDYVWQTIRDKYYDPSLGGLDWQAVRDELRPGVEHATSRHEARNIITALAHRLGKSHFNIIPADAYADVDADADPSSTVAESAAASSPHRDSASGSGPSKSKAPKRTLAGDGASGIEVRIVGRAAIVTAVVQGSPAQAAGIKPGWIIESVDGVRLAPHIQNMIDAFPESSSKAFYLAESVLSRLGGRIGDTVSITFLDDHDQPVTRDLTLAPMNGTKAQFGNLPTLYVFTDSKTFDSNIQYFRVNIFFDPPMVMSALATSVRQASDNNAPGFIIDLRGNPGGIGAMAMGFAGWFIPEKNLKLGTMTMRDSSINFLVNPRMGAFPGPLAILIDGLSGSTSEILAAGMQDLQRARLFGQHTAGAALPSTFEVLPNRDRFQYALADYTSVSGRTIEGNGVTPDQEVLIDRPSLLAGRDPVIDAAVAWIRSHRQQSADHAIPAHAVSPADKQE
ncbi:MAG: S41 family peptidase [Phycisphaerales bacterium]